jgi:hypothetical protein
VLSVYRSSDIEHIAVGCMDRIRCTEVEPDAGKKIKDDRVATNQSCPKSTQGTKINISTSEVPYELRCLSWLFSPIFNSILYQLSLAHLGLTCHMPLGHIVRYFRFTCTFRFGYLPCLPRFCLPSHLSLSHALLLRRRLWLKINHETRNKTNNESTHWMSGIDT